MKTLLFSLLTPLLLLLACASTAKKSDADSLPKAVPTTNEKLWLQPIADNSGISSLHFWPRDSLQQAILNRHIAEIEYKVLSEFRRCEKFGYYETVADSLQSTIRIAITLHPCSFRFDTLTLPVSIIVTAPVDGRQWRFEQVVRATAPADRRENDPFHYAGLLMVDLSNSFPYRRIVYPFYRPETD